MIALEPIFENFELYLSGLLLTLLLTVVSLSVGLALAAAFSVIKTGRQKALIGAIDMLVLYFRGTPCLIQIYLVYYGLAQFSFIRDSFLWVAFSEPLFCALFALTLNTAAYTTEILFGAIKATPKGEIEAAHAFGYSHMQSLRHIIFPSVIRRIIPLYANEAVFLMQATALASTITLLELTQAARIINSRFFIPFEAFIFAALIYMCMSYVIFYSLNRLDKHLNPARDSNLRRA